nr:unnamed protein product [Digitaria exilis]
MPAAAADASSSPNALDPPLPYWGGAAAIGREEHRWRLGMESASASAAAGLLEHGAKELAARHLGRTAHNLSSSSLRKKSDLALLRKVPCGPLRRLLDNLQQVLLATKLVLLFPAVILALAARFFRFGQASATMQADVSTGLLILGVLCHSLPLLLRYAASSGEHVAASWDSGLELSRACSIVMLLAYVAYLFFQLKTHRQLFEPQEDEDDGDDSVTQDEAVLGFPSAIIWLGIMTLMTAVLSEFVVSTIEAASKSWELSVSFISIILIPIVGNATEHAGAVIFAFKNKLVGISPSGYLWVPPRRFLCLWWVPLSVLVAWIMGVPMDLDFNLIETGSLFLAVLVTTFTLQDGSSHYLKGLLLLFCYIVIAICFFVLRQRGSMHFF